MDLLNLTETATFAAVRSLHGRDPWLSLCSQRWVNDSLKQHTTKTTVLYSHVMYGHIQSITEVM